ncbi:MAG TPA: glycerophosphodiester phosphodiesterase family protein [Candidatus Nitrosotenuis sp.]|nr:glycerophosphodiester phosphodiesterase family protein [Candidatus Nitrosotenuis sp.]
MPKVWVVGHRGASGHAPENTLAAFRRAVEMGAGFIETDLHITRDAKLVAIHDATLERTTNGRGAVKDFTLAELQQLDAGSWFHPDFRGERIPSIEEVIAFARQADIGLFLEIKPDAPWGIEHGLLAMLRGSGESHRVVVLSFSTGILRNVRRIDNTQVTGLLLDAVPNGGMNALFDRVRETGARQLAPRGDVVSPEMIEQAQRHDLQVICWTVNEVADMRQLAALGVHGIMTDFPDRLAQVLNES